MPNNAKLTARQSRLISALLGGAPSIEAAAKTAGIGRRTAFRYLTDPNVKAAIVEAQSAALADLSRRLLALGNDAADVLSEVMSDSDAAPGARVRAADVSLGRLLQVKELAELEERIKALEERITGGAR